MAARLPKRLIYLSPVIEGLATVPTAELNEDNEFAFSLVNNAVRQRIAGLTPSKAERTLEQDSDALSGWLAQPGQEQSPGHFISGVLLGILGFGGIDELLGNEPECPQPPPRYRPVMDPPEGYESSEGCGWVTWIRGDLQVTITPYADPPWTLMIEQPAEAIASFGIVDTKISFGDCVKGRKRLSVINRHVFLKSVGYVLEVPGGWVDVRAQSKRDFDETTLESKFHTLQVVSTEPGRTTACS